MRFGVLAALAVVSLLSGCEIFLDGGEFGIFEKAPIDASDAVGSEAVLTKAL